MIVVSNTSPITNLCAIGKLELLQNIYGNIIIPQAVYSEMANLDYEVPGTKEVKTLAWIETQTISNLALVEQLKTEIDPGEAEAIALAIEIKADRLIIDDYQGKLVASRLNLNFIGILGILLIAKQRGLIITVKPVMDDLINLAGFRINPQLYANLLITAGEIPPTE
jgi:predicted nucleic acid-binding protein